MSALMTRTVIAKPEVMKWLIVEKQMIIEELKHGIPLKPTASVLLSVLATGIIVLT